MWINHLKSVSKVNILLLTNKRVLTALLAKSALILRIRYLKTPALFHNFTNPIRTRLNVLLVQQERLVRQRQALLFLVIQAIQALSEQHIAPYQRSGNLRPFRLWLLRAALLVYIKIWLDKLLASIATLDLNV